MTILKGLPPGQEGVIDSLLLQARASPVGPCTLDHGHASRSLERHGEHTTAANPGRPQRLSSSAHRSGLVLDKGIAPAMSGMRRTGWRGRARAHGAPLTRSLDALQPLGLPDAASCRAIPTVPPFTSGNAAESQRAASTPRAHAYAVSTRPGPVRLPADVWGCGGTPRRGPRESSRCRGPAAPETRPPGAWQPG